MSAADRRIRKVRFNRSDPSFHLYSDESENRRDSNAAPVFLLFSPFDPRNSVKVFPIVGIRCLSVGGSSLLSRRKNASRLDPKRVRSGLRGGCISRGGRSTIEESTEELWRRYAADRGSLELRNRLAERYLPLVRYHAERVADGVRRHLTAQLRGRINADELESAGMLGLLDAVANFDPAGKITFDDYAAPLIREAIADEIRSLDWLPLSFFARGIRRDGDVTESEK